MSTQLAAEPTTRVAWSRVALFYGIALGGATVVAVALWWLRQTSIPYSLQLAQGGLALFYMPLPLVAGLIVEHRAGRRPLIVQGWRRLRPAWGHPGEGRSRLARLGRFIGAAMRRPYGPSAAYGVLVMVAILALGFAVTWLASAVGLPGAGHLVATDAEFRDRLLQIAPMLPPDVALPPAAVVAGSLLYQGLLAGLTINAVFAFGEEYGWRGVLADELRPLGNVRANLLTGVLWGLWHAPVIILLGHNYGTEWGWGVPMMVLWTTPFAFLLTWVRERARSVVAPAILHGAYNGTIGVFALVLTGSNLLVALPMGILMALVLTVLALVAWRWRR